MDEEEAPCSDGFHNWVILQQTPAEVIVSENGDHVVYVDPKIQKLAEEGQVVGCEDCGISLAEAYPIVT